MRQLANGVTELQIVNDRYGSPTYTIDFAHNVNALLKREYWGTYNMACSGLTSRLEVARAMLECRGSAIRCHSTKSPRPISHSILAVRPPFRVSRQC